MTPNVYIKQARLWQREIAERQRRGIPTPPDLLEAMAAHLAKSPAAMAALGFVVVGKSEESIKGEISAALESVKAGRKPFTDVSLK